MGHAKTNPRTIKQGGGRKKEDLFETPSGLLLALLGIGGVVTLASISPVLLAPLIGVHAVIKANDRMRGQKLRNALGYLERQRYVTVDRTAQRKKIALTRNGLRRARQLAVRPSLEKPLPRPSTWDGLWRLIIFDIAAEERAKRNAFRHFIRKINAVMLQKSVWIYPFDCSERIDLLREFFGLSDAHLRLIVAQNIGDDSHLRRHFQLP